MGAIYNKKIFFQNFVKNQKMKIFKFLAIFGLAAAQDGDSRGKVSSEGKGAQTCLGVQLNQSDFKCKHKKKKGDGKRKQCKLLCDGAKMKKVFCNEDGWGGKGGKKVNPAKLC